jgi:hypothetical protein
MAASGCAPGKGSVLGVPELDDVLFELAAELNLGFGFR